MNEHKDLRGISKISLVIKLNPGGNQTCSLCGRPAEEIQYTGPVLFIEGTNDAVCLMCGEEHAPELTEVLEDYFGRTSKSSND